MTLRTWPPALLVAISVLVGRPAPVVASCPGLEMVPVDAGAVVFVGEVLGWERQRTDVAVDAWYRGADAAETAIVIGGRVGCDRESSADWRPEPGERNAVVAEPRDDGLFETELCFQQRATAPLLDLLEERYGPPRLPPFPAAPAPTVTPTPRNDTSEPPGIPSSEPTSLVPPKTASPESSPVVPQTDAGPPPSRTTRNAVRSVLPASSSSLWSCSPASMRDGRPHRGRVDRPLPSRAASPRPPIGRRTRNGRDSRPPRSAKGLSRSYRRTGRLNRGTPRRRAGHRSDSSATLTHAARAAPTRTADTQAGRLLESEAVRDELRSAAVTVRSPDEASTPRRTGRTRRCHGRRQPAAISRTTPLPLRQIRRCLRARLRAPVAQECPPPYS